MNATVTMKEEVRTSSLVRDIPLDKIHESNTNPRTHFDEGGLAELADNIKQHGVLQPVLVRLRPNGASDSYELVVGSRRYRASKMARSDTIPVTSMTHFASGKQERDAQTGNCQNPQNESAVQGWQD
jgi:ParB/RepB/Spo0J family partition protein